MKNTEHTIRVEKFQCIDVYYIFRVFVYFHLENSVCIVYLLKTSCMYRVLRKKENSETFQLLA